MCPPPDISLPLYPTLKSCVCAGGFGFLCLCTFFHVLVLRICAGMRVTVCACVFALAYLCCAYVCLFFSVCVFVLVCMCLCVR